MFTRIGAAAFKKDLTNTILLCETLGNPQLQFKSIHIAGTNGKGSTSHMLAAVLQSQGYKTGLYTSPHLKDFRERIRINGKMISKSSVISFVKDHKELIAQVEPSFFELTVAMAFDHFARHQVDIAIIEVGLGGRLDSTNIIVPELSVITNISLDHVNMLGDTLEKIAFEKAGIIKPGVPVVIGETQTESAPVFIRKAKAEKAPLTFADQELKAVNLGMIHNKKRLNIFQQDQLRYPELTCDLTGSYQHHNIITVLTALEVLRQQSAFKIENKSVYEGLKQVKKRTGLQGRWQTLQQKPLVICDTGHNEAGIAEVIKNIRQTTYQHLHIVFGMVKDKDISKVLSMMPKAATYYFCKPDLERAMEAEELQHQAAVYELKGNSFRSVNEAKKQAIASADENDLVFIGGSTFVVAEAL